MAPARSLEVGRVLYARRVRSGSFSKGMGTVLYCPLVAGPVGPESPRTVRSLGRKECLSVGGPCC